MKYFSTNYEAKFKETLTWAARQDAITNSLKAKAPPVSTKASGTIKSSGELYIPRDANGNPIALQKQRLNGQDIPLPDPNASGPHTVLGGKTSSESGEVYRQSATFPEGTWPTANGQNVPWSEVHWSNHGRGDHAFLHQHIFKYIPEKSGWMRGEPFPFSHGH